MLSVFWTWSIVLHEDVECILDPGLLYFMGMLSAFGPWSTVPMRMLSVLWTWSIVLHEDVCILDMVYCTS
ncbi:hypothetical protein CEXT_746871 [Caerostris extrusa]|uniref:Uncharacterized protein n=1 Tax=Caerostris extrusa TaxID=172846 RepID=A0AAV4QGH8_CAEEX|nr:hypothetical protein CEXT_746871 [Caerostris extrusa]